MLSTDARAIAMDLLRPPPGYRLDRAVLTTYSLDLEALLALPLAVLAHADASINELLEDPLLLITALREAGNRISVFVDENGIAIPRAARPLYAMLESSVHPVRAPNGGAFHPKVWLARFTDEHEAPLLRVAVLSRNLTFDRSWDVALTSDGEPAARRRSSHSRDLGEFVRALPGFATQSVPPELKSAIGKLAGEAERTRFPSPDDFDDPIGFHALGLEPVRKKSWRPVLHGTRLLAIAPFANRTALDALAKTTDGEIGLISCQEALDAIPSDALEEWDPIFVLSDAAIAEAEDEGSQRPSGLHAKLVAIENGRDVSWLLGSANLTAAAYLGRNVEMMASVVGLRRRSGIDQFLDAGFRDLCEPYRRNNDGAREPEVESAGALLQQARQSLADANLEVACRQSEEHWEWVVNGEVSLPNGVEADFWPVSLPEAQARRLELPSTWPLPITRLTTFVAFRLRFPGVSVDDVRFTLKLPAHGMPEGRVAQVLRTLIDSPERFLQFLRALLGGLDGLVGWVGHNGEGPESQRWDIGWSPQTLLEDLLRAASRDPARLEPVRRLIRDLRQTEEGREIVPDDLFALWSVVDEAARREGSP